MSNDTYQKQQDAMKEVMDGILFTARKETQEKQKDRIEKLANMIDDPEEYYFNFTYQWRNALKEALSLKKVNKNNLHSLSFIYDRYDFIDNNITEIIVKLEGRACSADKSRYIIRSLIKFFTTEKEIKLNEDNYWVPKIFTHEQWVKYFEALHSFYYGNQLPYLKFLQEDFQKIIKK